MTLRGFFTGRAFVLGMLLVIGLGIFAYRSYVSETTSPEAPSSATSTDVASSALPTFSWSFAQAATLNLDGLPETDVMLIAMYPDGIRQSKLVDTTPGGCNALPDADTDSLPGTENVQCYAAGLGYRYKITRGASSYLVQRKTFEEALPNDDPPAYEYEVIADFPLQH